MLFSRTARRRSKGQLILADGTMISSHAARAAVIGAGSASGSSRVAISLVESVRTEELAVFHAFLALIGCSDSLSLYA